MPMNRKDAPRITRRHGITGARSCEPSVAAAIGSGPWLVVSPHDDDFILGMGLTIAQARQENIDVYVLVVTDGRMGYASVEDRGDLVATRHGELKNACTELGIEDDRLIELGYPDGSLTQYQGCNEVGDGLGQVLTGVIRSVRPEFVFAPTGNDLHPDHRVVNREVDMACCWATSKIWLEKGEPLENLSRRDYAVYCAFPRSPELEIAGTDSLFQTKMRALRCFESQECIDSMVARLEEDGPVEYLQESDWDPYRPSKYAPLFTSPPLANIPEAEETGYARDCRQILDLLVDWPATPWQPLVDALNGDTHKPLLLVGEGSSQLFPGGFAAYLAKKWGVSGSIEVAGGREAANLPLENYQLCFLSNSGSTRELVELAHSSNTLERSLAILGQDDGPLKEAVDASCILLGQPEEAVPATASVFAQALTLAQALSFVANQSFPLISLAASVQSALDLQMSPSITEALTKADRIWWADRGDQVGAELALKTMEVAGCPGNHAGGNLLLHGVEEVLSERDLVVCCGASHLDAEQWQRLRSECDANFLMVGEGDADWQLPELGEWAPLVHLVIGWRLLGVMAQTHGHNPDTPFRARKVGNPYIQ